MALYDKLLTPSQMKNATQVERAIPAQTDILHYDLDGYAFLADTRGKIGRMSEIVINGFNKIFVNPNPQIVPQVPLFPASNLQNVQGISMRSQHNYFPNSNVTANPFAVPEMKANYQRRYTVIPIPRMGLDAVSEGENGIIPYRK